MEHKGKTLGGRRDSCSHWLLGKSDQELTFACDSVNCYLGLAIMEKLVSVPGPCQAFCGLLATENGY